MPTYLSGIQPTGLPHFGNYFGAIRQHVELPGRGGEHFYFIADLHALTTSRDPQVLRERVIETAVTYLAFGLDLDRAVLFRQSDIPEVCELSWLLATTSGLGLLERAHSYKDKLAHGIKPGIGLFFYPVLMAADILAYDATHVPVGADQVQHVEITQDLAGSFNHCFGDVFTRPEPLLSSRPRIVGLDGEKMSKSYGNDVWVFESGKQLKKILGRITTDSRAPEEPKDPDGLLLFDFLKLFLDEGELAEWSERVRRGGPDAPGYGHVKVRLFEAVEAAFAPARARRAELLADPGEVERILTRGAEVARARAIEVRDRAYRACGLRPPAAQSTRKPHA